jgi:hypothetical protein
MAVSSFGDIEAPAASGEVLTASQKVVITVTPAKAGVQNIPKQLNSGFRQNNACGAFLIFYGFISFDPE